MQCYIFLKVFLTNFLTKSDNLKKNCGHYVCLASTYIAVTMREKEEKQAGAELCQAHVKQDGLNSLYKT